MSDCPAAAGSATGLSGTRKQEQVATHTAQVIQGTYNMQHRQNHDSIGCWFHCCSLRDNKLYLEDCNVLLKVYEPMHNIFYWKYSVFQLYIYKNCYLWILCIKEAHIYITTVFWYNFSHRQMRWAGKLPRTHSFRGSTVRTSGWRYGFMGNVCRTKAGVHEPICDICNFLNGSILVPFLFLCFITPFCKVTLI